MSVTHEIVQREADTKTITAVDTTATARAPVIVAVAIDTTAANATAPLSVQELKEIKDRVDYLDAESASRRNKQIQNIAADPAFVAALTAKEVDNKRLHIRSRNRYMRGCLRKCVRRCVLSSVRVCR